MKLNFLRCLIIVVIVLLISCSTTAWGPFYQEVSVIPKDKALIYIYRLGKQSGSWVTYDLYDGSTKIGTMLDNGYIFYFADPGKHVIWGSIDRPGEVTIYVREGQVYYVRADIIPGMGMRTPNLSIVPSEVGSREIITCRSGAIKK